jgi:hypothetical protein
MSMTVPEQRHRRRPAAACEALGAEAPLKPPEFVSHNPSRPHGVDFVAYTYFCADQKVTTGVAFVEVPVNIPSTDELIEPIGLTREDTALKACHDDYSSAHLIKLDSSIMQGDVVGAAPSPCSNHVVIHDTALIHPQSAVVEGVAKAVDVSRASLLARSQSGGNRTWVTENADAPAYMQRVLKTVAISVLGSTERSSNNLTDTVMSPCMEKPGEHEAFTKTSAGEDPDGPSIMLEHQAAKRSRCETTSTMEVDSGLKATEPRSTTSHPKGFSSHAAIAGDLRTEVEYPAVTRTEDLLPPNESHLTAPTALSGRANSHNSQKNLLPTDHVSESAVHTPHMESTLASLPGTEDVKVFIDETSGLSLVLGNAADTSTNANALLSNDESLPSACLPAELRNPAAFASDYSSTSISLASAVSISPTVVAVDAPSTSSVLASAPATSPHLLPLALDTKNETIQIHAEEHPLSTPAPPVDVSGHTFGSSSRTGDANCATGASNSDSARTRALGDSSAVSTAPPHFLGSPILRALVGSGAECNFEGCGTSVAAPWLSISQPSVSGAPIDHSAEAKPTKEALPTDCTLNDAASDDSTNISGDNKAITEYFTPPNEARPNLAAPWLSSESGLDTSTLLASLVHGSADLVRRDTISEDASPGQLAMIWNQDGGNKSVTIAPSLPMEDVPASVHFAVACEPNSRPASPRPIPRLEPDIIGHTAVEEDVWITSDVRRLIQAESAMDDPPTAHIGDQGVHTMETSWLDNLYSENRQDSLAIIGFVGKRNDRLEEPASPVLPPSSPPSSQVSDLFLADPSADLSDDSSKTYRIAEGWINDQAGHHDETFKEQDGDLPKSPLLSSQPNASSPRRLFSSPPPYVISSPPTSPHIMSVDKGKGRARDFELQESLELELLKKRSLEDGLEEQQDVKRTVSNFLM